ncbi:hypothetical protein KAT24_02285 [Candidatus Pacearchaeota archaeon]|nr:hypothetical protein [Candidatus Pacearchaeota archaeon]
MTSKRFLQIAERWMNEDVPEEKIQKIKKQKVLVSNKLESLVDFCDVQLQKGDRDVIYELFESAGKNLEDYYQVNDFKIEIENNRIVNLSMGDLYPRIIPTSIGNLSSLRNLSLWRSRIISLPESICNLNSLESLHVNLNSLTSLPESICNLNSLKYLNCCANYLTSLPENIGNLGSLEHLYVGLNKLISLPESIGKLYNLKEFSMFCNEITYLPESILNLSFLECLNLKFNPLDNSSERLIKELKPIEYLWFG